MTIGIFVFRRFGLTVPVSILAIGLLLQTALDSKFGSGYYSSHLWTVCLNLFLSGVAAGIASCAAEGASNDGPGHYSLLDVDDGLGEKVREVREGVRGRLDRFVSGSSEEDMFCYIPLNRCAMVLMVVGAVLIVVDASGAVS